MRRILLVLACLAVFGLPAQSALAAGGNYSVSGGTAREQSQVRQALGASSFDWNLIPQRVRVHVAPVGDSYSTLGDVYLDPTLLDSGIFSWGVVQHEFAHQVDFFLLDDAKRLQLNTLLDGRDWCYGVAALRHEQYGCERFASQLAWAYWPTAQNALKPMSARDEAGSVPAAQFRALLGVLIGAPNTVSTPAAKAYAPKKRP